MTIWHEDRLLIDGELVPAVNGATHATISPGREAAGLDEILARNTFAEPAP